jgi:hypothetical protein
VTIFHSDAKFPRKTCAIAAFGVVE